MKKHPLFTFAALHGVLWSLLSLIFFNINGFFTDSLGLLFTAVFIAGHIFLFAWLLGLLCWSWGFVGHRTARAASIVIASIFSLFLIIDLVVFSQYRFHIGLAMLDLFFGPAGREIFVFPLGMWLLTGLGGIIVILAETGLWIASHKKPLSTKWLLGIIIFWIVCFFTYNGLYAWGKFKLVPSIISQRQILPFAHPLSANRRLEKWGFQPSTNPFVVPKIGKLTYPLSPLSCNAAIHPQNILIFVIDSWRQDAFNPQVMPLLSSWAQRLNMRIFTNHLSGGNGTNAGIFSLFYGIPYNYWDDFSALHLPPVLISQAQEQGYIPAIFASSRLSDPPFHRNVFSSIDNLRIGSEGKTPWQRDLNAVLDFEQFLASRRKDTPFFGFIFLDAPHGYSYPQEDKIFVPASPLNYFLLNNHTDPTPYRNQYNNAVHFTDRMLDKTLHALQAHGLLQNTVIFITADHGQELNDSHHNFWGHNGNLTDYQTKVPLLVYLPKATSSTPVTYRTTHYDIAPTLLQQILHCTNPPTDYALGYNLFDSTPREFTLFAGESEKAIRIENDILVLDNFGSMKQYNNRLEPISTPLPAATVKKGLKAFRQFYK